MCIESGIRPLDELPIESLLAATRLVAPAQDDGLASRVESEGEPPNAASRITTAEGVRDAVFDVANLQIPPGSQPADEIFRGYPLSTRPRGAAAVFFGVWPLVIAGIGFAAQWRNS